MFTMKAVFSLLTLLLVATAVKSLDNGAALTPPMGWLSWARYTCERDCKKYPDDCISERLYKRMADLLVSEGYKDAGYEYVNVDDCWSTMQRDPKTGKMVIDTKRFPSGMKALGDYIHSKGLKFGLYNDVGTKTCEGYPGLSSPTSDLNKQFQLDADTYASWGVDSMKIDGCNANTSDFYTLFPKFRDALNKTGRTIVYSCCWQYITDQKQELDYEKVSKACNLWRNHDDIEDSWQSVQSIIDFYAQRQDVFVKYQGPGSWHDPDMVLIGGFGLSYEQSKTQMAMWAILASPLYMSNDLASVQPEFKKLLQNKHVISVNQDKLGIMGRRIIKENNIEVWVKPIHPIINGHYSFAVVYMNRKPLGVPPYVSYKLSDILREQKVASAYTVHDLFDDAKEVGTLKSIDNLVRRVNTSGSVAMVKLVPKM